jgi:multidrug efflux pump
LLSHEVTIGAPSTQWWIALSSAIVYGLAFATVLTLIIIPSMLMLVTRDDHPKPWFWQRREAAGLVF